MSKPARLKTIRKLQELRKSHIISYVTSTRPGLEVSMAMDSIAKIHEHLQQIAGKDKKKKPRIDLFLHSNGGDGTVPWRLVTLIREFCDKFSVLVPYRAFSAATLTALGADEIVMHRMGMLGPTDATVTNNFNPRNAQGQSLGISVEDVSAYLALVKEDAEIRHEDEFVTAFNKLAEQVHPLALGNVKRHISQSRMMAKKLLCLHMDHSGAPQKIGDIVENLTSKSYYHGHPINRHEAKEHFGLNTVKHAEGDEEALIWDLYSLYDQQLLNERPFRPMDEFQKAVPTLAPAPNHTTPGPVEYSPPNRAKVAYVESLARSDFMTLDYRIAGQRTPTGGTKIELVTLNQGWEKE